MGTRKQHMVTFVSPGTFFPESTTKPIEEWNTATACEMAKDVKERYGATPYAFVFTTQIVSGPVPDGEGGTLDVQPKEVARSGNYFLGGTVLSYDDIKDRKDMGQAPVNARCNGFWFMIENKNSYRSILPFEEGDCVVNQDGKVVERGDSHERKKYRKKMDAVRDQL